MFPTFTITGTPGDRGWAYGAQAADLIRHSIANYAYLFAYRRGLDWAAVQAAALEYGPIIGAFNAEVLEEVEGIAAGSGHTLGEILALNVRTELLAGTPAGPSHAGYAAAQARNRSAAVPDHGECTALAVLPSRSATGAPLLAQNWDWTGDQRAACIMLRVRAPGKPALLTLTEAGMVGKIGLNEAGVGVCLNILRSNGDGETPGVPVHVLLRTILESGSVGEARALATSAKTGASSNLLCADTDGQAVSIEVTPAGAGLIEPSNGLLIHTNHCLSPDTCALEKPFDAISSTVPRLNKALALLSDRADAIDRDAVMAVLRDESEGLMSICRSPDRRLAPADQVETVASVVMDLRERRIDVAPDIPSRVAFTPVAL